SLLPGETIYLRAEHESPFSDPYSPDSLYVSLRSLSTSEEEFVQLVETGPDTGIFQGSLPTALGASVRYDGTVQVQPGDTVEASSSTNYGTFSDQVTIGGTLNQPPVANPDTLITNENQSAQLSVTANDTDPESQPITLVSVTQGALGTVTLVD